MADLDAELLALAGGDSSDDEASKPVTTVTAVRSPNSSPGPSHGNKLSPKQRGVAQKVSSRAMPGASRRPKAKREDSEEGEA